MTATDDLSSGHARLVQHVAKAIAASSGHWPNWEAVPESSKEAFLMNARAAVSAYQEFQQINAVQ